MGDGSRFLIIAAEDHAAARQRDDQGSRAKGLDQWRIAHQDARQDSGARAQADTQPRGPVVFRAGNKRNQPAKDRAAAEKYQYAH